MFIKLTNANPMYRGDAVIIKTDIIRSVFRADVERSEGVKDTVTYLWAGDNGTWEVKESVEEVWDLLKS